MADDLQQAEDLIAITPEMIKAGVETLREHYFGEPLESVVGDVYLMMEIERRAKVGDGGSAG